MSGEVTESEPDYTELIDKFKRTGQIPLAWQWTARNLIGAANRLQRDRETTQAAAPTKPDRWFDSRQAILLLYGVALENLLKALLVAQGVDATSTGRFNTKLQTHNVLSLWRQANLATDDAKEDLLHKLQWSIEAGKYPVGVKPDPKPSPVWLALPSVKEIGDLLTTVEDALRDRLPNEVFEKTDLLNLCVE